MCNSCSTGEVVQSVGHGPFVCFLIWPHACKGWEPLMYFVLLVSWESHGWERKKSMSWTSLQVTTGWAFIGSNNCVHTSRECVSAVVTSLNQLLLDHSAYFNKRQHLKTSRSLATAFLSFLIWFWWRQLPAGRNLKLASCWVVTVNVLAQEALQRFTPARGSNTQTLQLRGGHSTTQRSSP